MNRHVILKKGKLTRSTKKAACVDIHSAVDVVIPPGEQALIPTGVYTDMIGYHCLILSRSGLSAKYGLSHRAGVIDEDYRGEWKVILRNEGKEPYRVRAGDKIAQCLFIEKKHVEIVANGGEFVDETRVRGEGGFGSTGK